MEKQISKEIDDYIKKYPAEAQEQLYQVYEIIAKNAPEATERISWGMPTFHYYENLVHFAMAARHIGLYPAPEAIEHFAEELVPYKTSKGAIRFPLNEELPVELIERIVQHRVKRVRAKHKSEANI